jgi:hypothetical protein
LPSPTPQLTKHTNYSGKTEGRDLRGIKPSGGLLSIVGKSTELKGFSVYKYLRE